MTVLLFLAATAALLLSVGVLFQVVRQNGRILLRLEAIEARLAEERTLPFDAMRKAPVSLAPGTRAPAFELPALEGGTVGLQELLGKRTVLVFFDPACGFCRKMAPQLAGFDLRKANDIGIMLIGSGDAEKTRELLAEHQVKVRVGIQQKKEVSELYGVHGTPTGYLVDEDGVIASELAVGAEALMKLAGAGSPPDLPQKGNKPLSESRITRNGLPAGNPAPPFQLPKLNGGELALSEYSGQRVLLVFSDPRCGPCMKLAPQLEQFHRQRKDPRVLMISRGDESENRQKAADLNLTFPIVLQRQWEISRAYGMFSTPIAFLIDERGVIARDVAVGTDAIVSVLNNTAVAV